MKFLAAFILTGFLSVSAHAYYSGAWGRLTLRLPVNDRWTTDGEVQHVRQSGYAGNTPFDYPLMFSYRQWLHYRPGNKTTISLSPFAWFRLSPLVRSSTDRSLPQVDEFRFTVAVKREVRLSHNFAAEGRSAVEYRLFPGQDIVRWRNRAALKYRLNNSWLLMPSAELLLNMHGARKNQIFDQWRGGFDVAHALAGTRLTASAGYVYISRLPTSASATTSEHYGVVRLLYNLAGAGG